MAYLSGIDAWLMDGSTNLQGREWRLRLSAAQIDVSNFTTGGWATWLTGIKSGELTARIFGDPANQVTLADSINFNLGAGSSYFITFAGVVVDVENSAAVDKAFEQNITAKTNGSFNTTFALAS